MAPDFLDTVVKAKKEYLAHVTSQTDLKSLADSILGQKPKQSLLKSLTRNKDAVNIIAEIKKASPSKGAINKNLDCIKTAQIYQAGGAVAVSVLTEHLFFNGSNEDLLKVRQTTHLPILRKDFIVSEFQIYETAALGADAILLIVRILSPNQLKEYIELAHSLNLECLVEINSKDDIEKLRDSNAKIIGINNRDLKTFKVNLNTAINLSGLLQKNQTVVALSGITTEMDILINLEAGIQNFLIGESLVKSDQPEAFLKRLRSVRKGTP